MNTDEHVDNACQNGLAGYSEEVISIVPYSSSDALKSEIRRKINDRGEINWDLADLFLQGQTIHLKFKYRN